MLRPSLVYGRGSFGGTSVLRGLAGLPFVSPLIGDGRHAFTPIHLDDLAATVLIALDGKLTHRTLDPCGPETLTLAEIVARTRAWLDLPRAYPLAVPLPLVRAVASAGDALGLGPVNSTALRQLEYGNAADPASFAAAVGFMPRSMAAAFASEPANVQDRWHARLYFLRPLLTAALSLIWLASGLIGLLATAETTAGIIQSFGLPGALASTLAMAACLLDIVLAISILATPARLTWISAVLQAVVVLGYTIALTIAQPALWSDPFGPLLKNLAVLALIGIWAGLREER